MWNQFLDPPEMSDVGDVASAITASERSARERLPIPIFFRACQGHLCLAHSIERMLAPYEPGLARCHGLLLHVTDHDTIKASMQGDGALRIPGQTAGLCRESDYDLLRLIPTRRDPVMEDLPGPSQIPAWLIQCREGEAPPTRAADRPGSNPARAQPTVHGFWPERCTDQLWQ